MMALAITTVALIIPASSVQGGFPDNFTKPQIQEDLINYKYPYSEVPVSERVQLVQYEINRLKEQITHFQPGQEVTLSYLKNTLAHEEALLRTYTTTSLESTKVSAYTGNTVTSPVAINLIYYGSNDLGADQKIIMAHPEFLVDNSPAGPQKGDANIGEYMAAGIKYFEYLDGGYEGTQLRSIPNDLESNLNYINAAASAGAYGIFLDEVSSHPDTAALIYLQQIHNKAHSLGLKIVFNTGVSAWSDRLMDFCDYMNSSEIWQDEPLTPNQNKYANRTWLETQEVKDANTAATLTEAAWGKGIKAEYACVEYITLPDWFDSYISQIRAYVSPNFYFTVSTVTAIAAVIVAAIFFIWRKRARGGLL